MASQSSTKYDLTKVLNTESLVGILGNKDVQERLNKFMPNDEKISQTPEELRAAVGSPQYQQAIQAFQEALESGQLAPVLGQFKLPENAIKAAGTGNVKGFAEAMQEANKKEAAADNEKKDDAESSSTGQQVQKDEDDDEDEKMAVD